MEQHLLLSDEDLLEKLSKGTLDRSVFTHQAHLRVSYIYLKRYGVLGAIINVQEQIKKYISFLGLEDKYHTTLTVAAIHVVHAFMAKSTSDNFTDFMAEFPELQNNFKGLIEQHYGFDIFKSAEARTTFIAPDLQSFEEEEE